MSVPPLSLADEIDRLHARLREGKISQEQFDVLVQALTARAGSPGRQTVLDAAGAPLFGEYARLGELGEGGMGRVYRARHRDEARARQQGGDVALKVLSVPLSDGGDRLQRFQREVAVGMRLEHPHIVRVLDHVIHGQQAGLVMELVPGRPLDEVLQERGALPAPDALALLAALCGALEHAHRQGVVHRDIKPENIMIRGDGSPVLLDFGIARDLRADQRLTRTRGAMGTLLYMAPEQFRDPSRVDARADVYALGLVLYQALTGRYPFAGRERDDWEIQQAKEAGPVPPLPTLDPRIELALTAATLPDPQQRCASCAELEAILAGQDPPAAQNAREWRRLESLGEGGVRAGAQGAGLEAPDLDELMPRVLAGEPLSGTRRWLQTRGLDAGDDGAQRARAVIARLEEELAATGRLRLLVASLDPRRGASALAHLLGSADLEPILRDAPGALSLRWGPVFRLTATQGDATLKAWSLARVQRGEALAAWRGGRAIFQPDGTPTAHAADLAGRFLRSVPPGYSLILEHPAFLLGLGLGVGFLDLRSQPDPAAALRRAGRDVHAILLLAPEAAALGEGLIGALEAAGVPVMIGVTGGAPAGALSWPLGLQRSGQLLDVFAVPPDAPGWREARTRVGGRLVGSREPLLELSAVVRFGRGVNLLRERLAQAEGAAARESERLSAASFPDPRLLDAEARRAAAEALAEARAGLAGLQRLLGQQRDQAAAAFRYQLSRIQDKAELRAAAARDADDVYRRCFAEPAEQALHNTLAGAVGAALAAAERRVRELDPGQPAGAAGAALSREGVSTLVTLLLLRRDGVRGDLPDSSGEDLGALAAAGAAAGVGMALLGPLGLALGGIGLLASELFWSVDRVREQIVASFQEGLAKKGAALAELARAALQDEGHPLQGLLRAEVQKRIDRHQEALRQRQIAHQEALQAGLRHARRCAAHRAEAEAHLQRLTERQGELLRRLREPPTAAPALSLWLDKKALQRVESANVAAVLLGAWGAPAAALGALRRAPERLRRSPEGESAAATLAAMDAWACLLGAALGGSEADRRRLEEAPGQIALLELSPAEEALLLPSRPPPEGPLGDLIRAARDEAPANRQPRRALEEALAALEAEAAAWRALLPPARIAELDAALAAARGVVAARKLRAWKLALALLSLAFCALLLLSLALALAARG